MLLVLPERTPEEAYALAGRVQDQTSPGTGPFTVSIGVASAAGAGTLDELLAHAAAALRSAKTVGHCTRTYT